MQHTRYPTKTPRQPLRFQLGGNAYCVTAIALFAIGFPVAEILLEKWGALALIALRNCLGFIFLLLLWPLIDGWRQIRSAPWLRGISIGALGFGAGSTLLLVSQEMTNAVTASLVVATMPVAAVVIEVVQDGRRVTLPFLIGLGLVLLGGVLAAGVNLSDARFGLGALVGVLATTLFAWGSRATVKNIKGVTQYTQVVITTAGMALFPLSTFFILDGFDLALTQTAVLDNREVGLLLIYAWLALGISQLLWIVAVDKLGVGIASFHLNAAPFYVMLILLSMGGSWNWMQAIGAAILCIGVIVSQKKSA